MDDDNQKWVTYYYPRSCRNTDGTLYMGTSSYNDNGVHASGATLMPPDHPAYDLWLWFLPRLHSLEKPSVTYEYLETLRPEFEQERQQAGSDELFRARLLEAVPVCPKLTVRERIGYTISGCMEAIVCALFSTVILAGQACERGLTWRKRRLK